MDHLLQVTLTRLTSAHYGSSPPVGYIHINPIGKYMGLNRPISRVNITVEGELISKYKVS